MIDKNFHRSDFLKFGLAFGAGALSACSSGVQPAIPSMKARETGYGAMVRSTANAVSMIAPASGKILIAVKISAEESGDIVASAASDFGDIPLSFSVNRSRSGSVNLGSGVTLTFSGGAAAFTGERVSGRLMRVGSDVQFDCPQVRLNGLRIPVPGLVAAKPSRGVLSAVCEELRDEYNWAMAGFIMAGISWIAMPLDPIAAGATGLAGADVQHILNQMKADGCAK